MMKNYLDYQILLCIAFPNILLNFLCSKNKYNKYKHSTNLISSYQLFLFLIQVGRKVSKTLFVLYKLRSLPELLSNVLNCTIARVSTNLY